MPSTYPPSREAPEVMDVTFATAAPAPRPAASDRTPDWLSIQLSIASEGDIRQSNARPGAAYSQFIDFTGWRGWERGKKIGPGEPGPAVEGRRYVALFQFTGEANDVSPRSTCAQAQYTWTLATFGT